MADDYATLDELKAARRIKSGTETDDAALEAVLTAASRAIDTKTSRRFWLDADPAARVFNPRGRVVSEPDGERLLVPDIGTTDGLIVETGYGTNWTAVTGYDLEPENATAYGTAITSLFLPYGTWGSGITTQRVRITARWGWPTVPDEINRATLILANRLYLRKDSPEGVAGTAEWGVIRLSRWDPDVESLVGPYVLPGIA